MQKRKKKAQKHSKIFFVAMFVCGFVAFLLVFVDLRLRPVIVTMAEYKMQSLITEAINDALIEVVDKTVIKYEDLVTIEKNKNGDILSLNYNSLHINRLKSEIIHTIINETQKIPQTDIYIPVGNVTNIDFLQNKGPTLKFRITPSSYVEADIESAFQTTGINQANHQIFIKIKVSATALIPNYSTDIVSENKVCIAETIIIGKVPNTIGNGLVLSD